jgi:hypothetical protein
LLLQEAKIIDNMTMGGELNKENGGRPKAKLIISMPSREASSADSPSNGGGRNCACAVTLLLYNYTTALLTDTN